MLTGWAPVRELGLRFASEGFFFSLKGLLSAEWERRVMVS